MVIALVMYMFFCRIRPIKKTGIVTQSVTQKLTFNKYTVTMNRYKNDLF